MRTTATRGTMWALARWVLGATVAGMLLGAGTAQAQSAGTTIAGPFTVILPSTQTFSFSTGFNVPPPLAHSYVLRVALSAANSLTTLSLRLNNNQIYALSDFAGGVTSVDKVATLLASNTIALQVAGAKGTKITITVLTVVLPKPISLSPSPLALNAAGSGTLTATLSPAPTASGTLSVTSGNAAAASVPASVSFASGQTSVAIPVNALAGGSSTVTAAANGGQAQATVNVNALPTASLVAPAAGGVYNAPASITVTANASDADGTVAKVDFFDGATLVGTVSVAPFSVMLANVAAGTHTYTARATDNLGATSTSAAITVTVDAPPMVSLTAPLNDAIYAAPATVTLSATATDSVGTVTKVDFYQGGILIGTAAAAPFTFNWTSVAAGNYALTAVATNDAGMATTSAAVAITVDAAPGVAISSPANGSSFSAPASINLTATTADTVGTITRVDFYQGTTLIGTVGSAPYSLNWTSVAAGNYSLTAVATNDAGQVTTSAPISVSVRSATAQMYFIHPDHLNTPRMIASSIGTTVWRWDQTEPFGDSVPNTDADGDGIAFDFPLRFPGQYFDRETGLAYNGFRDYDAGIGRYPESDPTGLAGGINTYVYVLDPLTQIDPEGLMGRAPGGWPGGPSSSTPAAFPAAPMSCEGEWSQRGFDEQLPKVLRLCTCYWLCIPCRYPAAWSGNKRNLPSTGGQLFYDSIGGALKTGNNCICKNKPGPETGCKSCPPKTH